MKVAEAIGSSLELASADGVFSSGCLGALLHPEHASNAGFEIASRSELEAAADCSRLANIAGLHYNLNQRATSPEHGSP